MELLYIFDDERQQYRTLARVTLPPPEAFHNFIKIVELREASINFTHKINSKREAFDTGHLNPCNCRHAQSENGNPPAKMRGCCFCFFGGKIELPLWFWQHFGRFRGMLRVLAWFFAWFTFRGVGVLFATFL